MTRRVSAQSGHCSQNMQLHFGLGTTTTIDSAIVLWSSGIVQLVNGLTINSFNKIVEDTTLTDIKDEPIGLKSQSFKLHQNYPNPFNPQTTISFTTEKEGIVTLRIYDILGNLVQEVMNQHKNAGHHSVVVNADGFSSGVYLYELTSNGGKIVKKLSILK
ncbi:hypothetical protein MASR1M107_34190 [Ignavibacteriales bacterium]